AGQLGRVSSQVHGEAIDANLPAQPLGTLEIGFDHAIAVEGRLTIGLGRDEGQKHLRVEESQDRLKQVPAAAAPFLYQQYPIHADTGGAELGNRSGLALADLGNAAAAGQIQMNVAIPAENANGQGRLLVFVHADPVKGDLLELLIGGVLVGSAHDQLLG